MATVTEVKDTPAAPVEPKKEKTVLERINELERDYNEAISVDMSHKKHLVDILQELMPLQNAFLKKIIEQLQAENKDLKERLEQRASNVKQ